MVNTARSFFSFATFAYRALYVLLLVSSLTNALYAQSIKTSIDKSRGTRNDSFVFSVEVSDSTTTSPPEIEGGSDFDISYLGVSRMIQTINGIMTRRTVFRYQLNPLKEGKLETPSVVYRNETFPPLSITVSKATKSQKNASSKSIFLKQHLSNQEVFIGQQVVSSLDVISSSPNPSIESISDISTEGVWQVQFPDERGRIDRTNGYFITTIRHAFFPLKSGTLTIPSREMVALEPVQQEAYDPFYDLGGNPFQGGIGGFFGQPSKRVQLASNKETLIVKPLPGENIPLVGLVSGKTPQTSLTVDAGKSAEITFSIISDGNLESLKSLTPVENLKSPTAWQLFWEKPRTRTLENSGRLFTEKTFSASLVGVEPGTYELAFKPIKYFDPFVQEYKEYSPTPIAVRITGTAPPTAVPTASSVPSVGVVPTSLPQQLRLDPEDVGTSLLYYLFLAGSLVLLSGLSWAAVRYFKHRQQYQQLRGEVVNAGSYDELRVLAQRVGTFVLGVKFDGVSDPRSHVSGLPGNEKNYVLLRVLDRLDEAVYSGNQGLVEEIRQELLQLLG
jgi:hypothetical protein